MSSISSPSLASAASSGVIAGASGIEGFDSDLFDDIAMAASAGVLDGASAIDGFDTAYYDEIAAASTEGTLAGAAAVGGFDQAALDALTEASAAGLQDAASEIDDIDAGAIAQAAAAGAEQGQATASAIEACVTAGNVWNEDHCEASNGDELDDPYVYQRQACMDGGGSFDEASHMCTFPPPSAKSSMNSTLS